MKRTGRWWLAGGLVLAVVASLLWQFVPLADAGARLEGLPKRGLGFASEDLSLTAVEAGIYGKARVVKRLYQVGRQRCVVVVIDGTRNRHAVHDPTFCFRGAGWTVTGGRRVGVRGGESRLVELSKGPARAEAMYWISDGERRHASVMRYWWQTTLRRVSFGRSGSEPVLVVVQPAEGGVLDWGSVIEKLPGLLEI
jgi:hypothetical protein